MKKKLIGFVILVFSLYLVFVLGRELFNLLKKGERTKNTEEKVVELKRENKALKERLEYVKSDEFVEKEARDKLNMAKEDEIIVVLPENLEVKPPRPEGQEGDLPNWQQWLRLFF